MTDRTRELLDVYGADPARWPAGERDEALAVLATDGGLRAARAEAAQLDTLLDEWATRDLGRGIDAGAAAARVLRPSRSWLRAAAGGSIAAALAGAAILFAPVAPTQAPTPLPAVDEATAFAAVFTATPDEDDLI